MIVVTENDNTRHRPVKHEADRRIWVMSCGLRVAMIGQPHPETPGHHAALPGCKAHGAPARCPGCY